MTTKLKRRPKPEYPPIDWDGCTEISVGARPLLYALEQCSVAMGVEEVRYYLRGIFVQYRDLDSLTLTATDGHRLVSGSIGAKKVHGYFNSAIWSDAHVKTAIKWLKRMGNAVVYVNFGKAVTTLSANGSRTAIAHVDHSYPDWERVVPEFKHYDDFIHVNRAGLLKAIKEICTPAKNIRLADKRINYSAGCLRFTCNNELVPDAPARSNDGLRLSRLHLSCQHETRVWRTENYVREFQRGANRGKKETRTKWHIAQEDIASQETRIDCEPLGKPASFGVNPMYLRELIQGKGKQKKIMIAVQEYSGPIRIDCGDGFTRVLMPMRI